MDKNRAIEKIAKDLCHKGGDCFNCSAANSFECTAKKYAKKVYDLYFNSTTATSFLGGKIN